MTREDVIELLHKSVRKAGGVRSWARQNDLSAAYVSDVLNDNRKMGPAILEALGIEAVSTVTTYKYRGKR